jgi:DNA-binding MarR family transcriptional regulator
MSEDPPGWTLARSGLIASEMIKQTLAGQGLKPGHAHVLKMLNDQGPLSQQAILEAIGVDPSVLVSLLNDLEGDDLAVRRRNPTDRRRHIVELTTKGRKLAGEMADAIAAGDAELFADLSAAEIATLCSLLSRIKGPQADCTGEH